MLVFLRHCFESVSYNPISGYAQPYSSSEATYATMYGNPEAAYAAYGSAEATYAGTYANSDAYSTTNQVCYLALSLCSYVLLVLVVTTFAYLDCYRCKNCVVYLVQKHTNYRKFKY